MNVLEINRNQLISKIAEIVPWDYKVQEGDTEYPFLFTAFAWGYAPVRIKCRVSQEEFEKLCRG